MISLLTFNLHYFLQPTINTMVGTITNSLLKGKLVKIVSIANKFNTITVLPTFLILVI